MGICFLLLRCLQILRPFVCNWKYFRITRYGDIVCSILMVVKVIRITPHSRQARIIQRMANRFICTRVMLVGCTMYFLMAIDGLYVFDAIFCNEENLFDCMQNKWSIEQYCAGEESCWTTVERIKVTAGECDVNGLEWE